MAAALRGDLETAVRSGASLLLGLELDGLHDHPWETLCLPPGEPLAVEVPTLGAVGMIVLVLFLGDSTVRGGAAFPTL